MKTRERVVDVEGMTCAHGAVELALGAAGYPGPVRSTAKRSRCPMFEEEILDHLDAVHRFALRLTRDTSEAEDLVQETYLRALEKWDRLEDWWSARAWLMSILRHLYLDRYRRRCKRRVRVDLRNMEGLPDPRAAEGVTADVFAHVLDTEVDRALQLLPLEYREAIVLCDANGLSYAETARVVGVPEGTVKSRLYRGRQILKKALYHYATARHFIPARIAGESASVKGRRGNSSEARPKRDKREGNHGTNEA